MEIMSQELPHALTRAIEALADLPGIGSRSAERLIFTLLRRDPNLAHKIASSLNEMMEKVQECEICAHLCETKICSICKKNDRDEKVLCVVEQPMDVLSIERTHEFRGKYHVLHGLISPMQKISPEDLRIQKLLDRVKNNNNTEKFEEIILALSGSTEAEATGFYIAEKLSPIFSGKITKLAQGIPSGGSLDYLDMKTIGQAMMGRRGI
jgi:recombination protein RecR